MYYKRKGLKYTQGHSFTVFLKNAFISDKAEALSGYLKEILPGV
jgi:hypothetical protein